MDQWDHIQTDDWGESQSLGERGWRLVAVTYDVKIGNTYYWTRRKQRDTMTDGDDPDHGDYWQWGVPP